MHIERFPLSGPCTPLFEVVSLRHYIQCTIYMNTGLENVAPTSKHGALHRSRSSSTPWLDGTLNAICSAERPNCCLLWRAKTQSPRTCWRWESWPVPPRTVRTSRPDQRSAGRRRGTWGRGPGCTCWRWRSREGRCSGARQQVDRSDGSPPGGLASCSEHCCTGDLKEIPCPGWGNVKIQGIQFVQNRYHDLEWTFY